MKSRRKERLCLAPSRLAPVFLVAWLVAPGCSADRSAPASKAPDTVKTAPSRDGALIPARPGMVVHIDPATGALTTGPSAGGEPLVLTPDEANALSTSHEGLVEERGPTEGSGYRVDLKRRFRHLEIATVDAEGRVRVQHLSPGPGPVPDPEKGRLSPLDSAKNR